MESLIRNRNQVKQVLDFTGVQNRAMHPSDIDFCLEFDDEILILGEVKRRWNDIPTGQELLLTRIADRWGHGAFVLKVEHEYINDDKDIPLDKCYVTACYTNYKWKEYDYSQQPIIGFLNKIGTKLKNDKLKF